MPLYARPAALKKRPKNEFAQEVQYQPKKLRRGGQTIQPIAASSTFQPPPSAVQASPPSRPLSPSPTLLDDIGCTGDAHENTSGHTRNKPGQVSCPLLFNLKDLTSLPPQTGNDLLDDWLPHRNEYLSVLLENEGV
jgi:hypothetical protein